MNAKATRSTTQAGDKSTNGTGAGRSRAHRSWPQAFCLSQSLFRPPLSFFPFECSFFEGVPFSFWLFVGCEGRGGTGKKTERHDLCGVCCGRSLHRPPIRQRTMASNLFAAAAQATDTSAGKLLVAFRAGKMTVAAGNRVTADTRRGKIEVRQGSDQLIHFQWRDRQTGDIVDDLIVFPDEAHLRKLKQVKDGRVLLLEFTGSERRLFFWMQEPSDDRDAEFVTKVNEMMNNPPSPTDDVGMGEGGEPDLSQLPPHLLQQIQAMGPAGMQQAQQLMQMFQQRQMGGGGNGGGSPGPSPGPSPKAAPQPKTPAASPGSDAALANVLSGFMSSHTPAAGESGSASSEEPQSLARVMKAETLLPLLTADEGVAQKLLEFLPEGQQTMDELKALPTSGQWQQFLDTFGSALQSGQLGAILAELGIPELQPVGATRGPTLEEFFAALEKKGDAMDDK
jgi:26S proteasome regulatory subunit N13